MGIHPLTKIKAESDLGRRLQLKKDIHPALNSPFWKKSDSDIDQKEIKARALEALAQEKNRIQSLAWMLAAMTVSEESKVDLATLTTVAEQGGIAMSRDRVTEYIESPQFQKKWLQVANELQAQLLRLKDPVITSNELSQIPPEALARYYEIAKKTAFNIQNRSKSAAALAQLKNLWATHTVGLAKATANFGLSDYAFLKEVEPNDFVVSQFWKQFVTDYSLAIVQEGLVGPRANLNDPQALAADPHKFLWTNSGHFSEMFGQVRVYGINFPASMALIYQNKAEVVEDRYLPIENQSLAGTMKSEGFFRGIKEWARGASNITQADYGAIWMRSLKRKFVTIQASYLMMMVERVLFGGQSFGNANPAFVYSMIWGLWQFGWMWEPITRGNQLYQAHLEENASTFLKAKSDLGTAIRFDDSEKMHQGMMDLIKLYDESNVKMPDELSEQIDLLIHLLESDASTLKTVGHEVKLSSEQIADLRFAIATGDLEKLKRSKEALLELYQNSGASVETVQTLIKLNAVSLLEFSLQNPPFAVKPHPKVEWITTLAGALLTTYYATALSVDTFRQHIPWTEKIGRALLISAALYATTYYAPRFWVNYAVPFFKKIKDTTCNLMLNSETH